MAKVDRTYLRGMILPDTRLSMWTAHSGEYNAGAYVAPLPSAGARAGTPASTSSPAPRLKLRATGEQTEGTTIEVQCLRGGLPVPDGAGVAVRRDTDTNWLGWESPSVLAQWEPIVMGTAGASGARLRPHCVTLPDGQVVGVWQVRGAGAYYSIYDAVRSVAGTWTESTVALGGADDSMSNPCLVVLPSGRVLLYAWQTDATESVATVRMWYSDDLTSAWVVGAEHVLPARISTAVATDGYTPGRLRAVYSGGQIVLFASIRSTDVAVAGSYEVLVQYQSSDGGQRFTEVCRTDMSATSPKEGAAYFDAVAVDGLIHLLYVDVTTLRPQMVTLGSAGEPFTSAAVADVYPDEAWGTLDGGSDYFTDGDAVLVAAQSGALYAYGRLVTVRNAWMCVRSVDRGTTWEVMTEATAISTPGAAMALLDTASWPSDAAGCWQRGRTVLVHGATSSPSTYGGGSLWAAYLGGASTVTMPVSRQLGDGEPDQTTWFGTYLPIDLPANVGWTRGTTGAPTESVATGILVLDHAALESTTYDYTPSGSVDGGIIVQGPVSITSTGSATLRARLATGAEGYEVVCSFSQATGVLTVSDGIGGGNIDTENFTSPVEVRVALAGSSATVWIRAYSTSEERTWTQAATTAALTDDGGATVTTNRIRFTANAAAAPMSVSWRYVLWTSDGGVATRAYLGDGLATPPTNPDDLFPLPLTSTPVWVGEGVSIWGLDGPAYRDDAWEIDVEHDYSPSDVLPHVEPSPRRGWRSVARSALDATTTHIHLAYTLRNAADVLVGNDVWGLYLDSLNCGEVLIDLYYGAAWHNVTTTPTFQFTGARSGNTLRAAAAYALGSRVRRSEWADCGIAFVSGGGGAVVDWTGEISANTDGTTSPNSTAAKRAILQLTGITGSESASPLAVVWPRRMVLLIQASGFSSAITGIRLRIPVSTGTARPGVPYDGYYALGVLAFGPAWVAGDEWAWGRTLRVEPTSEMVTLDDGTRRVRTLNRPRRSMEVSLRDGADTTRVRGSDAPDWLTASENAAAEGVAQVGGTPLDLQDLMIDLQGPGRMVVYVPHLERDTSSTSSTDVRVVTEDWAGEAVYGRIVSGIEVKQVIGDELVDEIYEVGELVVDEEV